MYSTPSNLLCTRYEQVIPVGALTADVKTKLLSQLLTTLKGRSLRLAPEVLT